jgi:hypothetical protein
VHLSGLGMKVESDMMISLEGKKHFTCIASGVAK